MKNNEISVKKNEDTDKQIVVQNESEKWDLKIEWDEIDEWDNSDLKWIDNYLQGWECKFNT